jgi:hypothetical protein
MADFLKNLTQMLAQSSGAGRDSQAFSENVARPAVDAVLPDVPTGSEALLSKDPEYIDRVLGVLSTLGVPVTGKMYARAMMGDKRPASNEDFSEEELQYIEALAQRALENGDSASVGYEDYDSFDWMGPSGIASLFSSPVSERVSRTLGQFSVSRDGDGGLIVEDQYNFNPNASRAEGRELLLRNLSGSRPEYTMTPEMTAYEMLRSAGETFGPRGDAADAGFPVQLRLNPRKP